MLLMVNPLFQRPFSIANCSLTRGYFRASIQLRMTAVTPLPLDRPWLEPDDHSLVSTESAVYFLRVQHGLNRHVEIMDMNMDMNRYHDRFISFATSNICSAG